MLEAVSWSGSWKHQHSSREAPLGGLEQAGGRSRICHSGMCHWLTSPKAGAQPPFSQWENWGLVPWSSHRAAGHLLPLWEPWCRLSWVHILTAPSAEVLHTIIQNNSKGKAEVKLECLSKNRCRIGAEQSRASQRQISCCGLWCMFTGSRPVNTGLLPVPSAL